MELDVSDLKAAADVLDDVAPELVGDAAEGWVRDTGDQAERAVRRRAGRHHVTGAMESRIRSRTEGGGVRAESVTRVDDRIAAILVRGSRAHPIVAFHGRALSITSRGAVSFAHRVRHPGTAADPFVERALDDTADAADTATTEAGNSLAGALATAIERRT